MIFFKRPALPLVVVLMLLGSKVFAQEPNFSMYQYTPFYTNPGQIGTEENVRLMLNYRNQTIESGENFRTSSISGYYPIYRGNHRLVLAGNFLNDQAANFVSTNGGMLGLAYSIRMTATTELSLGLQGGYFQRNLDDDNFTTDDQFINGSFDPNAVSGDAVLNRSKGYPTLSGGVFYQIRDGIGRKKAFLGTSIFNSIEPNISFIDSDTDNLPMSLKSTAGYRVYQGVNFSILPNIRWINKTNNNILNLGSNFGYELENNDKGIKKIEMGMWYNTNDLGIVSLAYEQPGITIGASYDIPLGNKLNMGKGGIFEVALSIRLKNKKQAFVTKKSSEPVYTETKKEEKVSQEKEEQTEVVVKEPEHEHKQEKEKEKVVSKPIEETKEEVNEPIEQPVLTPEEKKLLAETVRFKLNSDDLTPISKEYLDEVIKVLKRKVHLKIELTGYTCNLGAEKINDTLSEDRANIVSQYLVKNGISKDRLILKAGGENNPVASNDTEEGRRKNRRVEFKVIE